ncbi:MAG: HEAT repeat domain-containing protein [Deltaproteobacteria bacterium]
MGPLPESLGDRLRVIESLADRGREAVPDLVALLSSTDPRIRYLALFGLGCIGPDAGEAAAMVRERLGDKDGGVRDSALSAFARIRPNSADVVEIAALLLADSDVGVQSTAVRVLKERGRRIASVAIQSVTPMTRSERVSTRRLAMEVLEHVDWRHDEAAVAEAFRSLLHDPDQDVRAIAVSAVVERGAACVDEIRGWLRDGDDRIAGAALRAVPFLGAHASQTLPELLVLVDRREGSRLQPVLSALASLKTAAQPAVPQILRCVETLEDGGKLDAAATLLEVGANAEDVVHIVTPLLTRSADTWRAGSLLARASPQEARLQTTRIIGEIERAETSAILPALQALCGLGPEAEEAVALLSRLAQGPPGPVRYYSIEALGEIGPSAAAAVPILVSMLSGSKTDTDASPMDEVVAESLGKVGSASRSAVPALLEILEQPVPSLDDVNRRRAYLPPVKSVVVALGRIGENSEKVRGILRLLLTSDDFDNVHLQTLQSLITLERNSESVLPDLVRSLADNSSNVRLLAALAITSNAGDRRVAVDALTALLTDQDPWVCSAAVLALREIGRDARSAEPTLRKLREDKRNAVPNAIRAGSRVHHETTAYWPAGTDLQRLSVDEAACSALAAIQSEGTERIDCSGKRVSAVNAP